MLPVVDAGKQAHIAVAVAPPPPRRRSAVVRYARERCAVRARGGRRCGRLCRAAGCMAGLQRILPDCARAQPALQS